MDLKQTVDSCQMFSKLPRLDWFLNLHRDFCVWKVMSTLSTKILILIYISWLSKATFRNCQGFLDRRGQLKKYVSIYNLDQDLVMTNWYI
jgi:hypothetical protein